MNQQDIYKRVVTEIGLESLPPSAREEILAQLSDNILRRAMIALIDALPKSARADFTAAASRGDGAALRAIIDAHIPLADDMIATEIRDELELFKQESGGGS